MLTGKGLGAGAGGKEQRTEGRGHRCAKGKGLGGCSLLEVGSLDGSGGDVLWYGCKVLLLAPLAQRTEQRRPKPCVTGSTPVGGATAQAVV